VTLRCVVQVAKGFDWLSCLMFDSDDDTLIAGFHAVQHSSRFLEILIFKFMAIF